MTSSTTSTPGAAGGLLRGLDEVLGGCSRRPTSAPSSRQASSLAAEAVATTVAPERPCAIWMAAVPTPDAPACTSADRPAVSPPWHDERVPRGDEHLGDGGGVGQRRPAAGTGSSWRSWTAMPLGVGATADDAHHLVADAPRRHPLARARRRVPASSMPGISWSRGGAGLGVEAAPLEQVGPVEGGGAGRATTTSSGPGTGSGTSATWRTSGSP